MLKIEEKRNGNPTIEYLVQFDPLKETNYKPFRLPKRFVETYSAIPVQFGFTGLGEIAYKRTYSRIMPNQKNEQWHQTIERVVNGVYDMQKRWTLLSGKYWNNDQAIESATEMYSRIFHMKFLPPGRGLWAMGSPITDQKRLYAALNNCAFVSTENLHYDYEKPFTFLMDMSMLGVGVGFDTRGKGKIRIKGCDPKEGTKHYVVDDSREGWVDSVRLLLRNNFLGGPDLNFDYNKIRKKGSLIKGFGGISSGPESLMELHRGLKRILKKYQGKYIDERLIVDIQNLIGKCVESGNVRRTAEIAFGQADSEQFLNLKNYTQNPEREVYGGVSNNSVFAELGTDYSKIADLIRVNGEPGIAWLENMQRFGRMSEPANNKDIRARGGNPCLEQTLESYELCCLVETFPAKHESLGDFLRTLKFAYLYGKTVTLGPTHWPETNEVMGRNRRIGCSMSGIAQFLAKNNLDELIRWCDEGYKQIQKWDKVYSDWFGIPRSIKTTSIKPSGTVSLLAGATSGVHFPESRYFLKRMRIKKDSSLLTEIAKKGYPIEEDVFNKNGYVIEIPVDVGKGVKTINEVSMREQIALAAILQSYWADNQVSCTIQFREDEAHNLERILDEFQYCLKGITFLPRDKKSYPQMPQEAISEQEYLKRVSKLKPLNFSNITNELGERDTGCDSDVCELKRP